jgi:hypothetical protein
VNDTNVLGLTGMNQRLACLQRAGDLFRSGCQVALLVNGGVLGGRRSVPLLYPDHWVALASPAALHSHDGAPAFTVYSGGALVEVQRRTQYGRDFLRGFYGFIAARKDSAAQDPPADQRREQEAGADAQHLQ